MSTTQRLIEEIKHQVLHRHLLEMEIAGLKNDLASSERQLQHWQEQAQLLQRRLESSQC